MDFEIPAVVVTPPPEAETSETCFVDMSNISFNNSLMSPDDIGQSPQITITDVTSLSESNDVSQEPSQDIVAAAWASSEPQQHQINPKMEKINPIKESKTESATEKSQSGARGRKRKLAAKADPDNQPVVKLTRLEELKDSESSGTRKTRSMANNLSSKATQEIKKQKVVDRKIEKTPSMIGCSNCKLKCSDKFTAEERANFNSEFQKKSNVEKKGWVSKHCWKDVHPKSKTFGQMMCHLPKKGSNLKVCRQFFLATLGFSKKEDGKISRVTEKDSSIENKPTQDSSKKLFMGRTSEPSKETKPVDDSAAKTPPVRRGRPSKVKAINVSTPKNTESSSLKTSTPIDVKPHPVTKRKSGSDKENNSQIVTKGRPTASEKKPEVPSAGALGNSPQSRAQLIKMVRDHIESYGPGLAEGKGKTRVIHMEGLSVQAMANAFKVKYKKEVSPGNYFKVMSHMKVELSSESAKKRRASLPSDAPGLADRKQSAKALMEMIKKDIESYDPVEWVGKLGKPGVKYIIKEDFTDPQSAINEMREQFNKKHSLSVAQKHYVDVMRIMRVVIRGSNFLDQKYPNVNISVVKKEDKSEEISKEEKIKKFMDSKILEKKYPNLNITVA